MGYKDIEREKGRKRYFFFKENNPEKFKEKNKRKWILYKNKPKNLFKMYITHCKASNRDFLLNFDKFSEIIAKNCCYCGKENSLGVDRKDNSIGYTLENSLPCCKICNFMKGKLDYDIFMKQVKMIAENLLE